jgi:hypothetical protein
MNKITTIYWRPSCMMHFSGAYSNYEFVVALHVDVVSWKILAYTLRMNGQADRAYKPPMIDSRNHYGFWLWQAIREFSDLKNSSSISPVHPNQLEFDCLGTVRVIRKLPPGQVAALSHRLMKGFYDLDAWFLAHMRSPVRVPNDLLLLRLNRAIRHANRSA